MSIKSTIEKNFNKGLIDPLTYLKANIQLSKIEDGVLEKARKGEGSRGGKVIGHTKSGSPIYEKPNSHRIDRAISGYHHNEDTLTELQSHIDHHQRMSDYHESKKNEARKKMADAEIKGGDALGDKSLFHHYYSHSDAQRAHEYAIAGYKMAHAASKIMQDHKLNDPNDSMSMFSNIRSILRTAKDHAQRAHSLSEEL